MSIMDKNDRQQDRVVNSKRNEASAHLANGDGHHHRAHHHDGHRHRQHHRRDSDDSTASSATFAHNTTSNGNDLSLDNSANTDNANANASAERQESNADRNSKEALFKDNMNSLKFPFPWKIHELLEDVQKDGRDHIVSWMADGTSFRVHKEREFVDTVMTDYFNQSKFTSFTRQLYIYGFQKLQDGPSKGAFHHKLFVRGKQSLCLTMRRKRDKPQRPKRQLYNSFTNFPIRTSSHAHSSNSNGVDSRYPMHWNTGTPSYPQYPRRAPMPSPPPSPSPNPYSTATGHNDWMTGNPSFGGTLSGDQSHSMRRYENHNERLRFGPSSPSSLSSPTYQAPGLVTQQLHGFQDHAPTQPSFLSSSSNSPAGYAAGNACNYGEPTPQLNIDINATQQPQEQRPDLLCSMPISHMPEMNHNSASNHINQDIGAHSINQPSKQLDAEEDWLATYERLFFRDEMAHTTSKPKNEASKDLSPLNLEKRGQQDTLEPLSLWPSKPSNTAVAPIDVKPWDSSIHLQVSNFEFLNQHGRGSSDFDDNLGRNGNFNDADVFFPHNSTSSSWK